MHTTQSGRHRTLFVLQSSAQQLVDDLIHQLHARDLPAQNHGASVSLTQNTLYLPTKNSTSDRADQINKVLGNENFCVVFDATEQFDPGLFAAACGTVIAGGAVILITSGAPYTQASKSPGIAGRVTVNQHSILPTQSAFASRFTRLIHEACVPIENALALRPYKPAAGTQASSPGKSPGKRRDNSDGNWLQEQNRLLATMRPVLHSDAPGTIVIQAERGRGKSALCGRLVGEYVSCSQPSSSVRKVVVTAAQRSSCDVFYEHVHRAAGSHVADVEFMAIETVFQTSPELLVVEEAGVLSVAVLERLLASARHAIFITTVQGYEGAGRGFALRFSRLLDNKRPGWLQVKPEMPVRYARNDPLEAFVNKALLLDTDVASLNREAVQVHNSSARRVSQQQLCDNETLLRQIYGLLVQAHYQTTPADLQHMLDSPTLQIYGLFHNEKVIGAALVSIEGSIDPALHMPVVKRQRRLSHQILPQLLAQLVSKPDVLSEQFARVVRIAIHPALQRRGLGSRLLQWIQQDCGCKSLGASFGADSATLGFWLKQGMLPFHLGFRRNPRSGLKSASVLQTSHPVVAGALQLANRLLVENVAATQRLLDTHDVKVSFNAQEDTQVTSLLLGPGIDEAGVLDDAQLLQEFCCGERSFIDSIAALERLANTSGNTRMLADLQALSQAIDKVGGRSRKQLERSLRNHLKALLD